MTAKNTTRHDNNFGFLRLFFASLVILSHSPELIDGNRSRELLTRIFGTLSFGEVAVDGFFLVSGYLITMSFDRKQSLGSFLVHRVLRIVPGYLVNYWICILVVAPMVGAGVAVLEPHVLAHTAIRSAKLLDPQVPGAFAGLPVPLLNGAAWTIAYEFRCYIAVAVLGTLAGLMPVSRSALRMMLTLAVGAMLIVHMADPMRNVAYSRDNWFGGARESLRFFCAFGVGALFYLHRSALKPELKRAGLSILLLGIGLLFKPTAEVAFDVFGGYLIFYVALGARLGPIKAVDRFADANGAWRLDISYGLYLYAFPIQNLLILGHRAMNPWVLCCLTLCLSGAAGALSWLLIEKRCNGWARRGVFSRASELARQNEGSQGGRAIVLDGVQGRS